MSNLFFSYFFQYVSCFDFYGKLERSSLANGFVRSSPDSEQLIHEWDPQNHSQAGQVPPSFLTLVAVNLRGILHLHQKWLEDIDVRAVCAIQTPSHRFESISHEGGGKALLS